VTSASDVEAESCDFCAIARGEDRSVEVVCEEESWIAFFPLDPATPGHTLVIPRQHVVDLWEVEPPLGADLMAAVIRVGCAIGASLKPEGMNLITSAGKVAEQTVFHLHFHVVPRWQRDGFGQIWPVEGKFEDADLEDVADRIREACSTSAARK
jgi:diadenosine tetraphosphate (Ap4A) HIT family hydrolase